MGNESNPEHQTIPPDRQDFDQQPRWRLDFPIDVPQDNYQARRDFTKFLVLTSFAFVVGQFWIALQNLWKRSQGTLPRKRIAALDHISIGEAITFRYPSADDSCLLIRIDENELIAYASECTHLQCPVLPKIASSQLHCPCHIGIFDLATGRALAGPPRRPLPRIRLDIKNNFVYATGIEEDIA